MLILLCLKDAPNDVFSVNEWIADFLLFNNYRLSFEEAKDALRRDVKRGKIVVATRQNATRQNSTDGA